MAGCAECALNVWAMIMENIDFAHPRFWPIFRPGGMGGTTGTSPGSFGILVIFTSFHQKKKLKSDNIMLNSSLYIC